MKFTSVHATEITPQKGGNPQKESALSVPYGQMNHGLFSNENLQTGKLDQSNDDLPLNVSTTETPKRTPKSRRLPKRQRASNLQNRVSLPPVGLTDPSVQSPRLTPPHLGGVSSDFQVLVQMKDHLHQTILANINERTLRIKILGGAGQRPRIRLREEKYTLVGPSATSQNKSFDGYITALQLFALRKELPYTHYAQIRLLMEMFHTYQLSPHNERYAPRAGTPETLPMAYDENSNSSHPEDPSTVVWGRPPLDGETLLDSHPESHFIYQSETSPVRSAMDNSILMFESLRAHCTAYLETEEGNDLRVSIETCLVMCNLYLNYTSAENKPILLATSLAHICRLFPNAISIITDMWNMLSFESHTDWQYQSEETPTFVPSQGLTTFEDKVISMIKLALTLDITDLTDNVTALDVLEGYSAARDGVLAPNSSKKLNLIGQLYDFVKYVGECAHRMALGDHKFFLEKKSGYSTWYAKYLKFNSYKEVTDFNSDDLLDLIKLGKTLLGEATDLYGAAVLLKKPYATHLYQAIDRLNTKLNTLQTTYANCGTRDAPFTIMLEGPTGVGKSYITKVLIEALAPYLEFECTTGCMFNIPPDARFWETYNGLLVTAVIFDDPNIKVNSDGTDLDVCLRVANNSRMVANMPDLSDKGIHAVNPRIFVVTTNDKNLGSKGKLVYTAALLRRFPIIITPIPKQRYRLSEESTQLDPSKIPDSIAKEVWSDIHYYRVQTVVMVTEKGGNEKAVYTDHGNFSVLGDRDFTPYPVMCRQDLMKFLIPRAKEHMRMIHLRKEANQTAETNLAKFCVDCDASHPIGEHVKIGAKDPRDPKLEDLFEFQSITDVISSWWSHKAILSARSTSDYVLAHRDSLPFPIIFLSCLYIAFLMSYFSQVAQTMPIPMVPKTPSFSDRVKGLYERSIPHFDYVDMRDSLIEKFKPSRSVIRKTALLLAFLGAISLTSNSFSSYLKDQKRKRDLARPSATDHTLKVSDLADKMYQHFGAAVQVEPQVVAKLGLDPKLVHVFWIDEHFFEARDKAVADHSPTFKVKVFPGFHFQMETLPLESISSGKRPERWGKPPLAPRVSPKLQSSTIDHIMEKVAHNTVTVRITTEQSDMFTRCVGLYVAPCILAVNTHSFNKVGIAPSYTVESVSDFPSLHRTIRVEGGKHSRAIRPHPMYDYTLIYMPGVGAKDLLEYFGPEVDVSGRQGYLLPVGEQRVPVLFEQAGALSADKSVFGTNLVSVVGYRADTKGGQSGTPVLAEYGRYIGIYGLHCGISKSKLLAQACPIQPAFVTNFVESLPHMVHQNLVFDSIEASNIGPLSRKNDYTIMLEKEDLPPGECVLPLGTIPGYRANSNKTRVVDTIFRPLIEPHLPQSFVPKVAPSFKAGVVEGKWQSPIRHMNRSIRALTSRVSMFDIQNRANNVASRFEVCEVGPPLTDLEAIVGRDGVEGIDRIDMSTGAGAAMGCKKRDCFSDPSGPNPIPNAKLRDLISKFENLLLSDSGISAVFTNHQKDERVSVKKFKINKVRNFAMANLALNLALRKFLLPWTVYFRSIPFLGVCVGASCESHDWTRFKAYLSGIPGKLIAGDYAAYDLTIEYELMCAPMFLIEALIHRFDLTIWVPHIGLMWKLIDAIARPTYIVYGDVMFVMGTTPSGHSLTADWNSLINLFIFCLAFHAIAGKEFLDHSRALFYGDDNVVSTNEPSFTFGSFKRWLATIGMTFTTTDKSDDDDPVITWENVSFLKRTWVYNQSVDGYVAPLDLDSIYNMMCTVVASEHPDSTVRTQSIELLRNSHRELALHSEEYERLDPIYRQIWAFVFPEQPPLPSLEKIWASIRDHYE